jgi:RNA polymerase sigma-70 factor (ECF subfamily)
MKSTMNVVSPCSDDEIVRALHADDPTAMDRLVTEYWRRLVRYADGILAGEAGAEDVVQESFLRVWTRRRQLRVGGSLRALLFTLTRNGAIDARRKSARWAARAGSVPAPATPPSPLEAAAASELAAAATAAVSHLPARRRQIFVLVRLRGLSYQETAASLGVARQTVANQMGAALTSLREALAGHAVVDSPLRTGLWSSKRTSLASS